MNFDAGGSLTVLNLPLETQDGPAPARARTQALLADRFGLIVHHEAKEPPVYLLTVATGGLRMKKSAEAGPQRGIHHEGRGHAQGFAATAEMLAREISRMTGRAVIDKSGFRPNTTGRSNGRSDPDDDSRPSLFTALQEQLGLKLETAKGPVDVVVIDHVERPSQN